MNCGCCCRDRAGCFKPVVRESSRAPGFTLLELLAVIMVISVLLSLVLPGLDGMRGRDLADTATRLALVINHARQEAMLSSRAWRLEIDPEENTFRFQQRSGTGFIQLSEPPFTEIRLNPDIRVVELEIKGQPVTETGQVYLFPTGGQDAFSLTLGGGDNRRVLSMGPLGPVVTQTP